MLGIQVDAIWVEEISFQGKIKQAIHSPIQTTGIHEKWMGRFSEKKNAKFYTFMSSSRTENFKFISHSYAHNFYFLYFEV